MNKESNHKYKSITIIIFILILVMRIPYLNNSTAEYGDYWRQSDTESISRNFVEQRFNIFYPQMNYDGPFPNYVQLEFQLTTFIIAVLYKLFGYHYWLARLVPIGFFLVSAYFVYLTGSKLYSREQGWAAALIYGVLPINLFFSRAIMPEAALLCFYTGAFYFFMNWIENEKFGTLMIAAIFTCFAISQKTPAIFIGLAMLGLCIQKYKLRFLLKWELWVFAIFSLVPNMIYYMWSYGNAEMKFLDHIANKYILSPKVFSALFSAEAAKFYKENLPAAFGLIVLACAFCGLLAALFKREKYILLWTMSAVLEVIIVVSSIRFKYYLIMLGPIIALLSGSIVGLPWKRLKGVYWASFAIIIFVFCSGYIKTIPDFKEVANRLDGAEALISETGQDDLVVIGTFDPTILSLSGRQGWRTNVRYYDYIPKSPERDMKYYMKNGARYFLVYKKYIYGDKGNYFQYVDSNYTRVYQGKDFTLYKLQ